MFCFGVSVFVFSSALVEFKEVMVMTLWILLAARFSPIHLHCFSICKTSCCLQTLQKHLIVHSLQFDIELCLQHSSCLPA